jgi:hypothetical protein
MEGFRIMARAARRSTYAAAGGAMARGKDSVNIAPVSTATRLG